MECQKNLEVLLNMKRFTILPSLNHTYKSRNVTINTNMNAQVCSRTVS